MGNPLFWKGVWTFVQAIFGYGAGASATGAYAFWVGVARIALVSIASKALAPKVDLSGAAREKLLTVRDPIAPQRFVYGEDMLSGPIIFGNTAGIPDNTDLWVSVALAGHQVDTVTKYRLDNEDILLTDLSGAVDGTVDSGFYADEAAVYFRFGTSTQGVTSQLETAFPTHIGTNHRARGWCYMVWHFWMVPKSTVYEGGAPQNLRAVIKGFTLYDPRLDDTQPGGVGAHRLSLVSTWEWSDNTALCLAHFMLNTKFGMQEASARIDWPMVMTAADVCDELVAIPTATTQKRYTCNATFESTESRGSVRDTMLASMMGRMVFSQGYWKIWAGEAVTSDVTLDEDNLAAGISLQASAGAKERYNRVRGKFIDPSRDYTAASYPEQRSSTYETDDAGEVRPITVDWTACNNEYEAQRNAIITLKQSRQQRMIIFEGNLSCFRIQPGSVCTLDVAEFGFTGEKFFVSEWVLTNAGVQLTMIEEIDSSWADPAEGEYATRSATGALTFSNQGVPPPTAPSVTDLLGGALLSWTSPPETMHSNIEVWASDDNVRGNATLVATILGDSYLDQISDLRTRFYWLRSINQFGTVSLYEPNLTTTTLIGNNIQGALIAAVPSFAPGYIGGTADFQYTLNATVGGGADDGEIRVQSTTFLHPDGTTVTTDTNDFAIRTFYELTVVGAFYIMYSAAIAETRFGETAADWGAGDDTRFISVVWDSVNLWRARSNTGTYYAFTPLATDCIIAICNKLTASGGIESVVPLTGGTTGSSIVVANAYLRKATAPTEPVTDDGSYNFTTQTLTPPSIAGGSADDWFAAVPAGTDPLYVVNGTFEVGGVTGVDSTVDWSAPAILASDGVTGSSVFVGQVFLRKSTAPTEPITDDGEYNFTTNVLTPPSTGGGSADNWSVTVPAGTDPLYVSTGSFEISGATGIDSTVDWTAPVILASDGATGGDGNSVFVGQVFLRKATAPTEPITDDGSYNFTTNVLTPPSTGGGSADNWSVTVPAGTNPLYVSTGTFEINGTTGTDNTVDWTAPAILASDGAPGGDGGDGNSVHVGTVFLRKATAPTKPVGDTLDEYNFTTNILTPPTIAGGSADNWSITVPVGTNPLYVMNGTFEINGTTGIDSTVAWSTPVVLASDGAVGADGDDGVYTYLTNEAHVVPANYGGLGYDLTGSGGTHKVFDGTVDKTITSGMHSVVSPATKNGLTMSVVSGTGVYSLDDVTTDSWTTALETFTLRAVYNSVNYDKVYTITKAQAGSDGGCAIDTLTTINLDDMTGASSTVGFRVDSDGDIYERANQASSYVSKETWKGVCAAGSYECILNKTSGDTLTGSSAAVDTWHLCSTDRLFELSTASFAKTFVGTLQIRRTSDNVVLGTVNVNMDVEAPV